MGEKTQVINISISSSSKEIYLIFLILTEFYRLACWLIQHWKMLRTTPKTIFQYFVEILLRGYEFLSAF